MTVPGTPATFTITWDAPTTDIAGNLATPTGYMVYYGTSPGFYTAALDVGNITAYTLTIDTLTMPAGTYYVAVTAYDALGNESDFSNEVVASF